MKNKLIKYLAPANLVKCIAPALVALVMLLAAVPAPAAAAGDSISVTPSSIIDNVASGSTSTYTLAVTTGFALQIDVDGLGQTPAGASEGVAAADDTSLYTARPWVSVDKSTIQPGAEVDLKVTVKVPSGTTPSERYASIFMHSQPGAGDTIISGIIVPLIFTVDATSFTPKATGEISDLSVPQAYTGDSLDILTTLTDTGNSRITNATNTVTITDSSNNVKWTNTTPVAAPSVLPNYPRTIDTTDNIGLAAGTYTATSEIDLANSTVSYTKTTTFTVVDPPPVPAAPTLKSPGNGSAPGAVIDSLTPTFEWNPVSGADYYELMVFRAPYTTNDTVYYSDQLTSTSFTLPADTLFTGQDYSWQVTASNVSGTSNPGTLYFQTSASATQATTSSTTPPVSGTGTPGKTSNIPWNLILFIGVPALFIVVVILVVINRRKKTDIA